MPWDPDLVPDGVNVGGWFCLEDWFYSQSSGSKVGHFVATPNPDYNKDTFQLDEKCFVGHVRTIFPQLTHEEEARLLRPYFGCETDLVNLLLRSGLKEERILDLFWKHRRCYVTPIDLSRIRTLGLRKIRLPLTWCINYETPYVLKGKDFAGRDKEIIIHTKPCIVEDPFENDPAFDPKGMNLPCDKWVSIPIKAVEQILETAAGFGLQVLLDLHAFPGGSSAGTFNGVWPVNPRFWSAHYKENFRTIMEKLLEWMSSLSHRNPKAFAGLYGLTPMNEPAHMKGLYDAAGAGVPVPYQAAYDAQGMKSWAQVPMAEILDTLAIGVEEFRKHPVLLEGKKMLLMNVIETSFAGTFGGEDAGAFAASQKGEVASVTGQLGQWWRSVTCAEERRTWAVLDLHNYIAWNPEVKHFESIKDLDEFQALLTDMSLPFFQQLRERLGIKQPELLACSEYSGSTNQDTLLSTTSGVGRRSPNLPRHVGWQTLRDAFLLLQHRAARVHQIEMWFWTYHIRKNVNYQGEWSLQHALSPWPRLKAEGFGLYGFSRCLVHLTCTAGRLVAYLLKSPRSLWLQGLGSRFGFFQATLR
ncbi:unnamed protein product [Effrenium voratum]|uniref:Glycoside hydrolase family 5 domain-containing protein n=1 Tax=Effrenium voratum TaxID=2562239 RepID=A0AA36I8Q4_9DINO|nr:unnamed protein product [Effrenium voratum]